MGADCIGRFGTVENCEKTSEEAVKYVGEKIGLISVFYDLGVEDIERLLARLAGETCVERKELRGMVRDLDLDHCFDSIINDLYRARIIGITSDEKICLCREGWLYLSR